MSGAGGEAVAAQKPLWTLDALIAATGADVSLARSGATAPPPVRGDGPRTPRLLDQETEGSGAVLPSGLQGGSPARAADFTGVSIDTRTIRPGELFVALKDVRDGHEFVTWAFKNGAAAALVDRDYAQAEGDGPLLRVDDPLQALEALGRAARARLSPDARVIAVTGSAGKTTTKEMLRACLTPLGKTHASEKSYNNHWGVPLTLARMPADTKFAVFEIGMNHAGEITPLTKMVRPHVAIVTTVAAVHLEHFASVAKIAEAKAEIFAGLEPRGTAVIPADNAYADILAGAAHDRRVRITTFGGPAPTDVLLLASIQNRDGTSVQIEALECSFSYRLATPGAHVVSNSLAVAAALVVLRIPLEQGLAPLADFRAPQGRGQVHDCCSLVVIDESYNANPASMRAALDTVALYPRDKHPRRIAVLGDMLELGQQSKVLHEGLVQPIIDAKVDLVLACGPNMKHLYDILPPEKRVTDGWAPTSAELETVLMATVRAGDVVMIKGSNGSRMAPLVNALIARHTPATETS